MRKYWLAAVTIILMLFAAWLFTALFEQYEEELDAGYSKEARLNPYLAAKHFLEKNDLKVLEQTTVLDFSLIPTDDTVFLSQVDSMLLTESQIKKAEDWVAQGGFLVLGVGQEIEGHDSFLSRFDIEPKYVKKINSDDNESNDQLAEAIVEMLEKGKEPDRYSIHLADDDSELSVQALDRIVLNHPAIKKGADQDNATTKETNSTDELTASVSDNLGPRLLQFNYGKGGFVALSSTRFWQNKYIGKADHAYLLAYLMPKETTVHLFYNVTAPSLWELLKRYFLELSLVSIAMLLLWLWRVGLRVQGVKQVPEGQRRLFTENLAASAAFLASKKQYQPLIAPIKEDITAQMQRFHPGFLQLAQSVQTALIAERAEMPEETVQAWINYTNIVNNQDELIEALKLGNAIRRKL